MNKRLANIKTRKETGLDYVVSCLNIGTPFGKKVLSARKPFFPGQEPLLERELDRVERLFKLLSNKSKDIDFLSEIFMEIKDNSFTIERSKANTLTVVEIFELKTLLLQMKKLKDLFTEEDIPAEYILDDTEELLDILDPRGDRISAFYLYDEFSETLAELRNQKKEIERSIRKDKKAKREIIKKTHGIELTPKFEFIVSKSDEEKVGRISAISDLERFDEDYMTITFSLKKTETAYKFIREVEAINEQLEEEELCVRETLSREIAKFETILINNCNKIGELDTTLAKAKYAKQNNCIKPIIKLEHKINFKNGRNLQVEAVLRSKGKTYCPINMDLKDGVTCITGANMGGKTVSLKLVGMVSILTQYGFFVPCEYAEVGLSEYMQILVGDSQSLERGLSSFGSEMEELKEILDKSVERSLILIDEIASGTNPIEGLGLTKSIVHYLQQEKYITLITTHYEAVQDNDGVRNMQVIGLANADFDLLDKEIRYANRKQKINIISKYMDYRLREIDNESEIPKDALNIAKMLGISNDIIEKAKEYIK